MLLLDVGEHQHPFGADAAPIPQQFACARLDDAFVCHVRVDESFRPDEVGAGRVCDRERLTIRAGEHLHAKHEAGFTLHVACNRGHGRGDLRTDPTLEVRAVVHVLDGQRRESGVLVDPGLGQRLLDQRVNRMGRRWRTRHGAEMQHADERARRAEAFTEHRQRIAAVWRSEGHRLPPNVITGIVSRRTTEDQPIAGRPCSTGPMPWLLDDSAQHTPARLGNSQRQNREAISQISGGCVAAGVGTIFAVVYHRIVPRLGPAQAIGAITHRLCRLIWKILHKRVRYDERGPAVSTEAKKVRARKMIRELRSLGYRVELASHGATA